MTTLRDIDFGPCWDAPGVRGWFGKDGYWYHHLPLIRLLGLDFKGSTRVAKTTTFEPNEGNLPIGGAEVLFQPKELIPRCIFINPLSGDTLNSVGLAGPGARELIKHGLLDGSNGPSMISFMSNKKTKEERLGDLKAFVTILKAYLLHTSSLRTIALQLNLSCPNTGLDPSHLVEEGEEMLSIASALGIPLIVKINLLAPIESAKRIAEHPACDALCFTNALPFNAEIPWLSQREQVPWTDLFPDGSPLMARNKKFGGGGYSGQRLLPLVARYARKLREAGVEKPFNVGGGIRHARDVDYLVENGGLRRGKDSIFFASVAMARPWRVRSIITRAYDLLG